MFSLGDTVAAMMFGYWLGRVQDKIVTKIESWFWNAKSTLGTDFSDRPARLIEIINFIFAFLFFFLFPVLFLILYFANKKTINFFIVPRSWRFDETFPQAAWFCHIFWVSRPIFVPAYF